MLVLGMMSGTSADGMDVALAEITEGAHSLRASEKTSRAPRLKTKLVDYTSRIMPAALRKEVLRIAEGAACTAGEISQLNFRLGGAFAEAAISGGKDIWGGVCRGGVVWRTWG